MFAVPGWSVPTSALKKQTEPTLKSLQPSQAADNTVKDAEDADHKSKKRKRAENNVTKANLDEMFRRHIEGNTRSRNSKKENKKRKQAENPEAQERNGDGAQHVTQSNGPDLKQSDSGEQASGTEKAVDGDGQDNAQKKNKRRRKNKPSQASDETPKDETNGPAPVKSLLTPPATGANLTPLQQAMRQKLLSSRFRHLNQTLYTTPSSQALELFTANPELFEEYHAGFSRQVKESWPSNPVDGYIQAIRARGAAGPAQRKQQKSNGGRNGPVPLPRRPHGVCTIADLGCGDAQLARSLTPSAKKLNLKLLSYDLHTPDPLVTKADISDLPLEDGTVDIAVFCLSLMGTNWVSFVEEAWRILRSDGKGECWVSEVKSRFGKVTKKKAQIGAKKVLSKAEKKKTKKKGKDDAGSDVDDEAEIYAEDAPGTATNDETDITAFVEVFRSRGFVLKQESVDKSNKMFVKMEFVKHGAPRMGKHASAVSAGAPAGKKRFIEKVNTGKTMTPEEEAKVLKPCVYKTR